MKSKVTLKGQITIPLELRKKFNIVPGDELEFSGDANGLKLTKKIDEKAMRSTLGILKNSLPGSVLSILEDSRGKVDLP